MGMELSETRWRISTTQGCPRSSRTWGVAERKDEQSKEKVIREDERIGFTIHRQIDRAEERRHIIPG